MHPVTLATFNEKDQAEVLKNRLERAGVRAEVRDATKVQRFLFAREHMAGITVEVDRRDFDHACRMVKDWDKKEGVLQDAVHCPQCGSTRVEYPQYTRKFFTPAFHLSIGIALGLIKKEFYCEDCQYTWPMEEKVDLDRDALGWPRKRNGP